MDTARTGEAVTWAGPRGELQGYWAQAQTVRGAVLVIHENKGLNDWVRSVAARLAGVGYSALAIDLLSQEGGSAVFTSWTPLTPDYPVEMSVIAIVEP